MPTLVEMPLVPLGTHHAPQMAVPVTPSRVDHWIKTNEQIRSEGNNIPMPWGHQLAAVPHGDAEARRFVMARWNASFVEKLKRDPASGGLKVVFPVPPGWQVEDGTGDLISPTDGTRVREVSAGIGNWRDGKGKVWRDVILHAALCTMPVVSGQRGVTTATLSTDRALYTATLDTDGVEYLYTLGTGTMADDKDPKKKDPKGDSANPLPDEKPAAGKVDDLLDDGLPAVPPVPEAAPVPTPTATPVPTVSPDAQAITDCMSYAAAVGLPMPADTTPANFIERLKVAMSTAAALGFKLTNPAQSQQAPEAQIDTSTAGATPEANSPGMAYMSTEPGLTVTLSTEAAEIVEAVAQEKREALARRITGFEKAGHVRPEIAKRERDRLPHYKPAVDPVSKRVSIPEGVERLELLAEGATKRAAVVADLTAKVQPAAVETATLSTATAEPLPGVKGSDVKPDFDLKVHIRDMADAAGLEMLTGTAA